MKTLVVVSVALLAVASAVPASNKRWDSFNFDSCASTCSNEQKKFSYNAGTTYIYDYSVETETAMAGASEDSAKLVIQARAEIQAVDGCDFALLLKDVRLSHTDADSGRLKTADREDEFQRVLEGTYLRFSYDDGIITSVCPESRETTWALNFKRGLLTAFQNSMKNLDEDHKAFEADVTGDCEANFTVAKSWGWKKDTRVTKTKNLLACSKRDAYQSMYQIVPYKVDSEIQSLPILKSTHKCDYIIGSSKLLESANCEETHVYLPFSNHQSGGKTRVQQKLTFRSQKDGVDAVLGSVQERYSLSFDHEDIKEKIENGPEALEQKLKEICDQTSDDLRPETPRLYSELVKIIKILSKSDLERAYKLVTDKTICPKNGRTLKVLLDALPMAGTEGAVSLMTTLINSQQVKDIQVKVWLASLPFIQEPTSNMIQDGVKLLQGSSSSDAFLPVSAMVNAYCKKNTDCDSNYYISQTVGILKNNLPSYCRVDDKNLKNVLLTLRAIGNSGLSGLTSSLDTCISSSSSPLEVRVAAADAYRRMPCDESSDQRDSVLWTMLQDPSQDSELRIASYQAVMRCPNDYTLTQISQLLEKETDNHLGGFVYSHLNNLKESSDPLKQETAKAIGMYNFKKFDLNLLKYSSNHEVSFLINRLNLGITADSNVIMSSASPLPRSAMLNLTVDLFGSSINLLEFGGRVEGLEILVEKLLGPNGYFPSKAENRGDDKLSDVKGSFYYRVFGNEIFYGHMKGAQGLNGPLKMPNFLDILISLANRQEVAYTHSQQLMDVALIVPTVAGLPLEITVNGSMNLDLKAEGKADLRGVATSPRSMEIEGEIRPSAALEVTGTMTVNALITKLGLRMRNTMHSSTWLKGQIEINRGRVLNIEIQPPGDKMEIFNARSQFFIIHDDVEKEQNMIQDNYKEYKVCSGDKIATLIGVELCGELKFPNASYHPDAPYFPLTGPTSLSIMTHRRDTHTSYKLFARRKETKESSVAQFMMDTPNSKINRLISTDVTINYTPDKQIDVQIVSPWKKLNLNSALVTNKDILSFVGSVLMDDRDKYGLTTEVKISRSGSSLAFTPFIELTQSGQSDTLLSGLVNVDLPNKFDANLEVKGVGMRPYTVQGTFINQDEEKRAQLGLSSQGKSLYLLNIGSTIDKSGKDNRNIKIEPTLIIKTQDQTLISITGSSDYKADKSASGDITVDVYKMKPASFTWKISQGSKSKQTSYNVDLKLKSSLLTGAIEGDIGQVRKVWASKLKVTYNIPRVGTDVVIWNSKLNNRGTNTFTKYILTSNLDMKKYTDYNAGLNIDFDHKKKQTGVDVKLRYGANASDKKKVITLKSTLNNEGFGWKNADVDFLLKTQVPEKNVDFNIKMSHSHSTAKLDSHVNLKFTPYLKDIVDAGISLQDKSKNLISYSGQANLGIMGKKVAVSSDLTQKSAKNFQHVLDIQDFSGASHSVSSVYKAVGANGHEFTTDINVNSYKPTQLQGKVILDPLNLQAFGNAAYGNDLYNVSAQSKLTDAMKKWNFEVAYPDRQVQAEVEVKNMKEKVSGSVMVDWDAKTSSKSKVTLEGSYRNSMTWDSRVISGTIDLKTPFRNMEDLSADASYNGDSSQYSTKGKVSWGSRQETVTTSLVVKRPFSVQNIEVSFLATTPIQQFREIELQINHKLESTLVSSVKGRLEDKNAELLVKGENTGDAYNRDFSGLVELKTPFATVKDVSVSLDHKDDGRTYKTLGSLGYNSRKYGADLQVDHNSNWDNTVNNGKLLLSWPDDQLQTTWQHSVQGTSQIKSSLESTWSDSRRVYINLAGSNKVENDLRQVLGTVNVQTPWRNSREIVIKFDSSLGSDRLQSTASFLNSKVEKAVYNVLFINKPNAGSASFMVKSPLYDHKIHGQTEVYFNSFPFTTAAWIEWAPWSRIDFDGSLNAPSINDISLNTKLTTPFTHFENVIASASHRLEGSEYVSRSTVSYGIRKMIDFENRLRYDDDVKLLRTKLISPCPYMKSLIGGVQLTSNPDKFEGSADFELLPLVMKYDGFITWNYDPSNWNGKLRVNTPLRQLPRLNIASWSKKSDGSLRTSHIDIEPSPYGVYSLDTSYRIDLPYQLDISMKTPHPQFDGLGLSALYNPSVNALQSRLKVTYQPNKEVDTQLLLDWKNNFEGTFTVNTPFSGFEKNRIFARHDSNYRGFTCHGETSIGGKNAQGDVVYTFSKAATSGSINIVSPIPGYEKLSADFTVKGALSGMKGDASLKIGTNSLSTSFSNSFNPGLLRSSMELYTPYTKDLKLSFEYTNSRSESKQESHFNGKYGDKSVDGKVGLYFIGYGEAKLDMSINTPIKSAQVSLESSVTGEKVSGKASVHTDIYSLGDVKVSFEKSGSLENLDGSFSLVRNGESLADASVEANRNDDEIHSKVTTNGSWLPRYSAQVDQRGNMNDFNTKASLTSGDETVIDSDVTLKVDKTDIDITGQLKYRYSSVDNTHAITIHKEGTLNDFKVELNKKCNGEEITAVVTFKADDEIKGLVQINNLSSRYDVVGVQFEHSGDLQKFITTGKVTISSTEAVSGKLNFYRYNLQRIEASAEVNTPWDGYRYSSVKYRHEGDDNRLSCSLNAEYANNQKFSADLITQCTSTSHSFSVNLKTPFTGYEQLLLAVDFDNSKANGKAVLGQGMEFTLTGLHDPSVYPYYIQYQITTPFEILKQATFNLKGKPLDGSTDLVLRSLNKKIEVNGALQYENPYKMSFSTSLNSDFPGFRLLQLTMKNEDDDYKGKTSHLLLSWDPSQQIVVDGRYFTGSSGWGDQQYTFELNAKTPFERFRSLSLDTEHKTKSTNMQSVISLDFNQEKLVDLDVNFDMSSKYEFSTLVRKPWPVEYSTSYQYDTTEGEMYINWNRDDPSSNLRIKSSAQSSPSDNSRSFALTVFCPSRTFGIEHSLLSSADKLSSSGKLFWDQDDDSKLSYSLDISSSNRRRDAAFNGDFKLGLPCRTFGLSGSISKNDIARTADAAFSWDLGKDDSKRIEIQASVSGQEYTKADISVRLPAQNLQVDSALILNQGNTIIDGKTDISYSGESRKTLTLFSKLKNTPSSSSYGFFSDSGNNFNYSVELGMSHPETKVDVKIDSHLGRTDQLLTSSLGIRYMTVHRQMKNLALFAEIDKIRRQMSLVASGPSYNADVSGSIMSDEPLSLMLLGSLDGQERFRSTLDVNKNSKNLQFEIGQPDNLLSLKSYFPNSSAFQSEVFHKTSGTGSQEAVLGLRLLSPYLLHSRINWRPAAIDELENSLIKQIVAASYATQKSLSQINLDVQRELTGKYEDVTASVVEDLKPLLRFIENEFESFATDLENFQQKLNTMYSNNEFFIQDIGTTAANNYDYVSQSYDLLQNNLQDLNDQYREVYTKFIQTVVERLEQIQQYSFSDSYNQIVTQGLQNVMMMLDGRVLDFARQVRDLDLKLLERTQAALQSFGDLYYHPQLEFIRNRIDQLRNIDYSYYTNRISDVVSSVDLKPYAGAIYSLRDSAINRIVPAGVRDLTERTTNEIYQQAHLAYKHWGVEEALNKHLETSLELLKDIAEEEIKEYINLLVIKSPITVFDPENGRIEGNLVLPVEVRQLDRLPDFSDYLQQAADIYVQYAPNLDTIKQYAPAFWSSNTSTNAVSDTQDDDDDADDDIIANLNEYNPSRSLNDRLVYQS